jgi:hypothetical protein
MNRLLYVCTHGCVISVTVWIQDFGSLDMLTFSRCFGLQVDGTSKTKNMHQEKCTYSAKPFMDTSWPICTRDPSLFEDEMDIMIDYGLVHSAWRGATTRATNAGVSQPNIEWTNRWNTSGKEIATGPMHVIYVKKIKFWALSFSSWLCSRNYLPSLGDSKKEHHPLVMKWD